MQVKQFLELLSGVRKSGDGWSACCPAHPDCNPSLSISEGDDGRVLVHCHAGCTADEVCKALELQPRDLMPQTPHVPCRTTKSPRNAKPGDCQGQIIAEYDYCDERGELLFQAVRYDLKEFRQRRPKPGGGWEWSVKGVRTIPYRLPELLEAPPQRMIYIVEGEKDVDRLHSVGLTSTCNAAGAGKWTAEHAQFVRDRHVTIIPDNDDPGRLHADSVARSLEGVANSVRILYLPDLPEKGDVSDWLASGRTKSELTAMVKQLPEWDPSERPPFGEIEPFDVHNLPKFPANVLPALLRHFVDAIAHATQTPRDLSGLLALAICAAAIGKRVRVEGHSGWTEPVNLFVAVLMEPGNRKSAVFAEVVAPLRAIENELIEEARPRVARARAERSLLEAKQKKLAKRAVDKEDPDARAEALALAERLAKEIEPALPRLIADDATTEKLAMLMAENDGQFACLSAEASVFDLMNGKYNRGVPNLNVYLQGHAGDELIIDRVGRPSVTIDKPALTCGFAVQPAVFDSLAKQPIFRERGLLARFLFASPVSRVGKRRINTTPVPEELRTAYERTIRRLAALQGKHLLKLSASAKFWLSLWLRKNERMLDEGGELEILRGWGDKLPGAVLRIAGVLHCIECEDGLIEAISVDTLRAATRIADYLIPHADAVLNKMLRTESSRDQDAQYLLRTIKRCEWVEFSQRDVQQHCRQRFRRVADIDPVLKELERRHFIRLRPAMTKGPGRPGSPVYEVNPRYFPGDQNNQTGKRI